MARKITTLLLALITTISLAYAQTPPYNEIWYTTTDGRTISFDADNLVSNSYNNGRGVLKFRYRVTFIGKCAFENCINLTSITIPNSVTWIGAGAFNRCSSLTSITIPNSVTIIGSSAFDDCSSLTSITIPDSVTSIARSAFYRCSSLNSVKVSNKYCYDYFKDSRVSDITFMISNLEEYKEAQKLGAKKIAIDSKYASKDGLCLIDNGELILFIGKDLTKYTIPESVTSIERYAFRHCSSLTSITIPNSVTSIGDGAFWGCNHLTSITIGNGVTSIGEFAFYRCSSLTSITIPNSVTYIQCSAFSGCSSLKSVKVANEYCYDYVFYGDANITFYGANASDDGRCLIIDGELKIFIAKGITEYTIPESVKSIGEDAFLGCSRLTSITIPNSVKSIGKCAFYDCSSLTSITIPNSVTYIGDYAFWGCSSLTSITIGSGITNIKRGVVEGDNNLSTIICLASTPPSIYDLQLSEEAVIYVPKKSVKLYKKDPNWSRYKKQIKPHIEAK